MSGPMIATSLFPIYVDADVSQNGDVVDPYFDGNYPTIDEAQPGANFDGYSHMTLNFGETTEYITGSPGKYVFRVILTDATGSGWKTNVPFTVK